MLENCAFSQCTMWQQKITGTLVSSVGLFLGSRLNLVLCESLKTVWVCKYEYQSSEFFIFAYTNV